MAILALRDHRRLIVVATLGIALGLIPHRTNAQQYPLLDSVKTNLIAA